jgi:hypothetical protein
MIDPSAFSAYHWLVAVRKKTQRKSSKGSFGLIFWPLFFIVIIGLFMINQDRIRQTLEETQLTQRLFRDSSSGQNPPPDIEPDVPEESVVPKPAAPEDGEGTVPAAEQGQEPVVQEPVVSEPAEQPPGEGDAASPEPVVQQTPQVPAQEEPSQVPPDQAPETQLRVSDPPAAAEPLRQSPPPSRETRERTIYFIRIDPDGTVLRTQVTRQLPLSDSPMMDALRSLLQGPTPEEQRREIRNFVPQGARILDARVRGDTAYINFNEEFQYNIYGVEGYAAQLQQIVWTATEFSNVNNVQFLIEGQRLDYLGESIWIGSPIGRE